MRLIVGLGNPGRAFRWTRHNVGFCLIEALAQKWGIAVKQKGEKCLYGKGKIAREEVLLAKPMTYMNLSGQAVQWLINSYHFSMADLLILHDDLDLPVGAIRLRLRGGHGGHKGVKSIIETIGNNNFARLKMGIGRPLDPNQEIIDYLLTPVPEEEREQFKQVIAKGVEAVELILSAGFQEMMAKFHKREMTNARPEGK